MTRRFISISDRIVEALRVRRRPLTTTDLAAMFDRRPSRILDSLKVLEAGGRIVSKSVEGSAVEWSLANAGDGAHA